MHHGAPAKRQGTGGGCSPGFASVAKPGRTCPRITVPLANRWRGTALVPSGSATLELFLCSFLLENSRMKQGKERGAVGQGCGGFAASLPSASSTARPSTLLAVSYPNHLSCGHKVETNTSHNEARGGKGQLKQVQRALACPVCACVCVCVHTHVSVFLSGGSREPRTFAQILQLRELSRSSDELENPIKEK